MTPQERMPRTPELQWRETLSEGRCPRARSGASNCPALYRDDRAMHGTGPISRRNAATRRRCLAGTRRARNWQRQRKPLAV
jgi:hypothetical protein